MQIMNSLYNIILYLVILSISLNINLYSEQKNKQGNIVLIDDKFCSNFKKTDPIKRDSYLDSLLNKIIHCKGYVVSVSEYNRYHRQFRIVVTQKSKNPDIKFYIFTDNNEYINLLQKNDPFEFKGQFVIYTSLNSKKNSYIFDIILEDGALVVE